MERLEGEKREGRGRDLKEHFAAEDIKEMSVKEG